MLERTLMYEVVKTVALVASVVMMLEAGDKMESVVLLSLALSCAIVIEYIVAIKGGKQLSNVGINVICCIICLSTKPELLLPLVVVLLAEIIDYKAERQQFYMLYGCTVGLLIFILNPSNYVIIISLIFFGVICYIRQLVMKIVNYRMLIMKQKEDLTELEEKIKDNNRFIKTLRYTAALEERNRLAARLHDKVGHGISGSIIMLEASMMMLDRDSVKAKEGIEKSIANLREGVDDIRAALREERPVKSNLGLNEIKMKLDQFRSSYGIVTNLQESGNLQNVGLNIWQCIYENLEEVLTNILKHSNATSFTLRLMSMNKMLSVEFRDNGTNNEEPKPVNIGLGLETMEERTIKNGGRFFVEHTKLGFLIRTIFICK